MIVLYAITLGIASLLDAVLFWHAHQAGLLRRRLSDRGFRNYLVAAVAPAVVFAISIPIAMFDSSLALLSWLLIFPAEFLIGKYLRADV